MKSRENNNFDFYKRIIKRCISKYDIVYFLQDIELSNEKYKELYISTENKIDRFWKLFEEDKYNNVTCLYNTAKEENEWIVELLQVEDNEDKMSELHMKWDVLLKTKDTFIRILKKCNIPNSKLLLNNLYNSNIITQNTLENLENINAEADFKYALCEIVHLKNPDWYGKLLYYLSKYNTKLLQDELKDGPFAESMELTQTIIDEYVKCYLRKQMIILPDEIGFDSASTSSSGICSKLSYSESINTEVLDENDDEIMKEESIDNILYKREPKNLKLLTFQEELCEDALNGKNTIICSPTGSGKTIMAAHIINKHLDNNPEGRVVMVVSRVPLALQHEKTLQEYCCRDNRKVVCLCSITRSASYPVAAYLPDYQIMVVTNGTLCNAFTTETSNLIETISAFSLVLFDECHNAISNKQYYLILKKYFDEKKEFPDRKLPQIIGLTASPRCQKQNETTGIKRSLYELIAALDCSSISTVKKYQDDMEDFVSFPDQDIKVMPSREEDQFQTKILGLMTFAESLYDNLRKTFPDVPKLNLISSDKFSNKYLTFLSQLRNCVNALDSKQREQKNQLYSIYWFLKACYQSIICNQMFDAKFARTIIEDHWNRSGDKFTCDYDEIIQKKYKQIEWEKLAEEQGKNPSLEEIAKLIRNSGKEEDIRVIIFVKQVRFAFELAQWLSEVGKINSAAFVSHRHAGRFNISLDTMRQIMDQFQKGYYKALVATTILEEGYDVPNCNLVISYGHVSHETALIQRKGRARKKDSKYVLLLLPMLSWMERIEVMNDFRWKKMKELIDQFGNDNPSDVEKCIKAIQNNKYYSPVKQKSCRIFGITDEGWRFVHTYCRKILCSVEDMALVQTTHSVVANPDVFQYVVFEESELTATGRGEIHKYGGKAFCMKCEQQIGRLFVFWDIPFLYMKPQFICIENSKDYRDINFIKWKEVNPQAIFEKLDHESLRWEEYAAQVKIFEPNYIKKKTTKDKVISVKN